MNHSPIPTFENILVPSSPPINISNVNNNYNNSHNKKKYPYKQQQQQQQQTNNVMFSYDNTPNNISPLFQPYQSPKQYQQTQQQQQQPHLMNESGYFLSDPLDYSADENEVFTRQLNLKLKQNSNGKQQINSHGNGQKKTGGGEYFDANSDLGFLTVASKEDLIVCLNVLKTEIFQFKNLSQSLLSRLVTLEKGIGNEKSIRSSPNTPGRSSTIFNDTMEEGFLSSSTSSNSPLSNSPLSSYPQVPISGGGGSTQKLNNDMLLSNAISEIHRLIEKQKQYDSILSQREKIWDLELNKLTMSVLNRFPQQQSITDGNQINTSNSSNNSSVDHNFNSEPMLNEFYSSNSADNDNEHSQPHLHQQTEKQEQYILIKVSNPNSNSLPTKIAILINRGYNFIRSSPSTWKRVAIITVIIILWPIIAHFLWKLVQKILANRLAKNNKIPPTTQKTLPISSKLKNILPSTNSTGNSTSTSFLSKSNNLNNNNNINTSQQGILSRLFKKRMSTTNGVVNGLSNQIVNSTSETPSNIRAPDIMKAILQGASTGDGGSNNNLTNNTISSMNTMLNSVIPTSTSSINPVPASSSSLSNIVSTGSFVPSSSTLSTTSLISPTTSLPSLSNATSNATSNLINNLTPSAISSLNLPSSSSNTSSLIHNVSNDIPASLSLNNHPLPIFNSNSNSNSISSSISSSSNNIHNSNSNGNNVLFRMVKNILSQKNR
ncbi:hypothetical protein DLAC_05529 [Tieghemostelium lacteum]|uniref:Uncharacterized protein n=1 Tax=Tieghemostelium lacteum TaxID=361077 RepID=A0A151ZG38_TIELA|nr:hypothetical protein DLAC_05529 [Tieghemostelium lacteum]|eukprot:KYQ92933.1 hypothetical protein DLAC_05529 [Tieghemostelium lacteum]